MCHLHSSRFFPGYVDFVLKKKKEAEYRPPEDEGTSVTLTENISGAQGSSIQYLGSALGRATETNVGKVGTVMGMLFCCVRSSSPPLVFSDSQPRDSHPPDRVMA